MRVDLIARRLAALCVDAEHARESRLDERGTCEWSEVDEHGTVCELAGELARDLYREPRLSRTTDTGKRQQAHIRPTEQRAHRRDLESAAHQPSRRTWQIHRARRRNRQRERRILAQHRTLELPQRRGRLDPKLLRESSPRVLIGAERIGLPARPEEREHQLRARPLPKRLLRDQLLELADQRVMPTERELRFDPQLNRAGPELFESSPLRALRWLGVEIGHRFAAPETQSVAEKPNRSGRVTAD